jgi:lysophospholipase L1-like esterase
MHSKIFLAACLLFCIALGGTGYAQTRVACVGDSITAGWKLKEADKYVTKLGGLLGAGYDVRNFGHSAYSMLTIADKSYWYSPMFQAAQDFQPDIVTIMLGTNDAHPDYWPQYQSDYVSDYGDMITFFENLPSKPRVIVLGLPYLKPGGRYDGVVALDALLPGVAGAAEVDYVEIWDVQLDSGLSERQLMKDPIHPSAASHTIIAETVYPVIADGGIAVCGDGTCNAGEDACNCADDCGPAPASESRCSDLLDNDCDGPADCEDPDCAVELHCQSACNGNGICEPGEDCRSCPGDCDGHSRGRPSGRYCCGNGIREGPEGDGRCNGQF